jgi:hypothetical protein
MNVYTNRIITIIKQILITDNLGVIGALMVIFIQHTRLHHSTRFIRSSKYVTSNMYFIKIKV